MSKFVDVNEPRGDVDLFEPGRIGPLHLKNRIVKSPTTTATSTADGFVTQRTTDHYRALAHGGAGLVIFEYCHVDDRASKSIHCQTSISNVEHIAGLAWVASEIKAEGAAAGIQLNHSGRQRYLGTPPMQSATTSSWAVAEAPYGVTPEPMTSAEIRDVVAAFGRAAGRAVQAGFDLIEIHAAHGYLLSNFLSSYTNWRTDDYGGSLKNRARFLCEVVSAVRNDIPADVALSVRLSVTDYEPGGFSIDEGVAVSAWLEALGVDVVHVSGGHHERLEREVSPWYISRAPHRHGWEAIKAKVDLPIIASGSLGDPRLAAEVIRTGGADFIGLGRPLLADPEWARKAEEGRILNIVPCVRCNDGCMDRGLNLARSVGCTVNPTLVREGRFDVVPAAVARDVGVVGAGPAGLRAAAVLSDRGHRVTVYEGTRVGGVLSEFDGFDIRSEFVSLRDHLVHEVRRRGVVIVPETMDGAGLIARGHDLVVVASGAPRREFEGEVVDERRLVSSADLGERRGELFGDIVVVGGGLEGCDAALRATEVPGSRVTVLERRHGLLLGGETRSDVMALPGRLREAGVRVEVDTEVTAVTAHGVRATRLDARGADHAVAADWVVMALGRRPQGTTLQQDLRAAGVPVHTVGSAAAPGRLLEAVHSGYFVGLRL